MTRHDAYCVVLVDDQPAVREALRRRLSEEPGFRVVGEASGIRDALAQIGATQPHVVVIDIGLNDGKRESGLELARDMQRLYPETRAVIWSEQGTPHCIAKARAAGVKGYVPKSDGTEEVVKVIKLVISGKCGYPDGVEQVAVPIPELTKRELEVLQLLAVPMKNPQIAKHLRIKRRTVESHRASIMSKLGATDVVEMLIIAWRLGLIEFKR